MTAWLTLCLMFALASGLCITCGSQTDQVSVRCTFENGRCIAAQPSAKECGCDGIHCAATSSVAVTEHECASATTRAVCETTLYQISVCQGLCLPPGFTNEAPCVQPVPCRSEVSLERCEFRQGQCTAGASELGCACSTNSMRTCQAHVTEVPFAAQEACASAGTEEECAGRVYRRAKCVGDCPGRRSAPCASVVTGLQRCTFVNGRCSSTVPIEESCECGPSQQCQAVAETAVDEAVCSSAQTREECESRGYVMKRCKGRCSRT